MPKSKQMRRARIDVWSFRRSLLAWYDAHQRELPWRASRDPYRVWVSEIMLQQTRVDTVIPYFNRWVERFPTIDALAAADLDDVLKHWEGLGYYSRARNLHGGARVVRERYAGAVPSRYDALRELPGIGDYTAGAISSIAFGRCEPAVDGNVRRVLCRILDVAAPTAPALRKHAADLVDPERAGDFNQALMELGATVCTPRTPLCASCPVQSSCRAYANDTVLLRPAPKTKPPIPHYRVNTLVHIHDGRVLLRKRGEKGLLAGMWEFPECDVVPSGATHIGEVTHTFSHKRITYVVHVLHGDGKNAKASWVRLEELHRYALPAAQRKIEIIVRSAVVV